MRNVSRVWLTLILVLGWWVSSRAATCSGVARHITRPPSRQRQSRESYVAGSCVTNDTKWWDADMSCPGQIYWTPGVDGIKGTSTSSANKSRVMCRLNGRMFCLASLRGAGGRHLVLETLWVVKLCHIKYPLSRASSDAVTCGEMCLSLGRLFV